MHTEGYKQQNIPTGPETARGGRPPSHPRPPAACKLVEAGLFTDCVHPQAPWVHASPGQFAQHIRAVLHCTTPSPVLGMIKGECLRRDNIEHIKLFASDLARPVIHNNQQSPCPSRQMATIGPHCQCDGQPSVRCPGRARAGKNSGGKSRGKQLAAQARAIAPWCEPCQLVENPAEITGILKACRLRHLHKRKVGMS